MRCSPRVAAMAAATALLLAGCATQVNGTAARGTAAPVTTATTSSETSGSSSQSSTPSSSAASSPATSAAPATPASSGAEDSKVPSSTEPAVRTDIGKFGQVYTWTDGLQVTVAPGVAFTPSEYAASAPAAAYLSFAITITNGSAADYDPTLFNATAQSASKEAESIYDSDNGLTGSPTTTVLAGRDATFNVGFGVSDPADVVLELSPGFDYDSALFATDGALAAVVPAPAEAPVTGESRAKFGQTYGWPSGLEVSIAPGVAFTPSDTSTADPANAHLSFAVTITNRTGQPYDPSLFFVSAESGGKEADQIFDSANGFVGSPSTSVLDGHQSVFTVGFGVDNPADVVMEVNAGFDYDAKAIFTS